MTVAPAPFTIVLYSRLALDGKFSPCLEPPCSSYLWTAKCSSRFTLPKLLLGSSSKANHLSLRLPGTAHFASKEASKRIN